MTTVVDVPPALHGTVIVKSHTPLARLAVPLAGVAPTAVYSTRSTVPLSVMEPENVTSSFDPVDGVVFGLATTTTGAMVSAVKHVTTSVSVPSFALASVAVAIIVLSVPIPGLHVSVRLALQEVVPVAVPLVGVQVAQSQSTDDTLSSSSALPPKLNAALEV
jgi:hypothetical protein